MVETVALWPTGSTLAQPTTGLRLTGLAPFGAHEIPVSIKGFRPYGAIPQEVSAMITTGLHAIGWTVGSLIVAAVAIVSLYLTVLVLLSVVAPGAFT